MQTEEDLILSYAFAFALGVLLIVVGAGEMILSMVSTVIVIRLLGWVLIFAAIAQFVAAIETRGESGTVPKLLLAVLYAIVGGMLLRRPVSGAIAAAAIIAILLIADGLIELGLAFRLRGSTGGRGWLMSGGILSIVLGVVIWRGGFPLSAIWILGLFVGIRLVFKGIDLTTRHWGRLA